MKSSSRQNIFFERGKWGSTYEGQYVLRGVVQGVVCTPFRGYYSRTYYPSTRKTRLTPGPAVGSLLDASCGTPSPLPASRR